MRTHGRRGSTSPGLLKTRLGLGVAQRGGQVKLVETGVTARLLQVLGDGGGGEGVWTSAAHLGISVVCTWHACTWTLGRCPPRPSPPCLGLCGGTGNQHRGPSTLQAAVRFMDLIPSPLPPGCRGETEVEEIAKLCRVLLQDREAGRCPPCGSGLLESCVTLVFQEVPS